MKCLERKYDLPILHKYEHDKKKKTVHGNNRFDCLFSGYNYVNDQTFYVWWLMENVEFENFNWDIIWGVEGWRIWKLEGKQCKKKEIKLKLGNEVCVKFLKII